MASERRLIDEARAALPAVVQILAEGYDANNVQSLLNPRYAVPADWGGSGFFVEVEGETGYILTNSHVVTNSKKLKIKSMQTSEELFHVEVVGNAQCSEPDIALLRLPPKEKERFEAVSEGPIPYLKLADSRVARRGRRVKAIGYPYGMPEPNISGGEISNFLSGDAYWSERLVTDAAINPGNSGGPSIVSGGEVIGINTAIMVHANNIGFITPIHFFEILLPSFFGKTEPGLTSLGARFQPNSVANAKYFSQPHADGLIVSRLVPGGMLANADIRRGDILLSIDGHEIDRYGNAHSYRQERKANILDISREIPLDQETEIVLLREGKKLTVRVKAMPMPTFGIQSQPAIQQRRFLVAGGMLIQELSYEIIEGLSEVLEVDYWQEIEASRYTVRPLLVVTHIDSDSQADELFLELGEVIQTIDDVDFEGNLDDLAALLRERKAKGASHVLIQFRSGSYGPFSLDEGFDELQVLECTL